MDIYGFADHKEDNIGVSISSFFRDNLAGFGGIRGLDQTNIGYYNLPPNNPSDFIVSSRTENLANIFEESRIPDHFMNLRTNRILVLALNERIVNNIRMSPPDIAAFALWDCLGRSMRLWHICDSVTTVAGLVPPCAISVFKDTQEIIDKLTTMYVSEMMSTDAIRTHFDISFIGYCVARMVTENNVAHDNRVSIGHVADLIFNTDRSNWRENINFGQD